MYIEEQIMGELRQLGAAEQQRVLEFTRQLAAAPQRGERGRELVQLVGCIPADDLSEIEAAIREGCETVDANGW